MRTFPRQHRSIPSFVAAVIFLVATATLLTLAAATDHAVTGTVLGRKFSPNELNVKTNDKIVVRTHDLPFRIFVTYSDYACERDRAGIQFQVNNTSPAWMNVDDLKFSPNGKIRFYGENRTFCEQGFQLEITFGSGSQDFFNLPSTVTGVIVASLFACIGGSLIVAAFLIIMHRITNRRLMTVFNRYRVEPAIVDPETGDETVAAAKSRPRSNSSKSAVTQRSARNEKTDVAQNANGSAVG